MTAPAAFTRYADAKNAHDLDSAMAEWTDDAVVEVVPFALRVQGREMVRMVFAALLDSLSDYEGEIEGVVSEDSSVACWWRMRGANHGSFLGLPPTGQSVDVPVVSVFSLDGGRLASERIYFDLVDLCSQLGLTVDEVKATLAPLAEPAGASS